MATSKAIIKAALLSLENDAKANKMSEDVYCDRLAGIIQAAIQSASLSVPGAGLVAPSGGGTVSGTSITGSLS